MAHAKKRYSGRTVYYTAHITIGPREYAALRDEASKPVRYPSKRAAVQAADHAEVEHRRGAGVSPGLSAAASGVATMPDHNDPGSMLFSTYVQKWYTRLDLVETTMVGYKSAIECHLLPKFGTYALKDIDADLIAEWEKEKRAAGYMRSSITLWRGRLSLILNDAVTEDNLISKNPAARKRGRGRRTSRKRARPSSQLLLSPLDALLVAERMALMSGRDDEFVWEILKRWTGMRSGEIHGLETRYLINTGHPRRRLLQVEWQLAEVHSKPIRIPPKDESYRNIDIPLFCGTCSATK